MITGRGLAALRLAATLTHQHPGLVTQVLDGRRPVVRVAGPAPVAPEAGIRAAGTALQLSPCAFRGAVASAHASHRTGRRLQLLDLPTDPVVELAAGDGGRMLPGGIARVVEGSAASYVFGTFLAPDRCRDLARDILDDRPAPDAVAELVLCRDGDLEVTVVAAELEPPGDACADEHEVVDLMEELLARFVAAELLDDLARASTRR